MEFLWKTMTLNSWVAALVQLLKECTQVRDRNKYRLILKLHSIIPFSTGRILHEIASFLMPMAAREKIWNSVEERLLFLLFHEIPTQPPIGPFELSRKP